MVPDEDPQRPGVPTCASNREPNATPVHRIMTALVKVPTEKLEALAGHVERLAGWDRLATLRDAQAADELADLARGPRL